MTTNQYNPEDYFSEWDIHRRGERNPYAAVNAYHTSVVLGNGGGGGFLGRIFKTQRKQYLDGGAQLNERALNKLIARIEDKDFAVRVAPLGDQSVQLFINDKPVYGSIRLDAAAYERFGGDMHDALQRERQAPASGETTPTPIAQSLPENLPPEVRDQARTIAQLVSQALETQDKKAVKLIEEYIGVEANGTLTVQEAARMIDLADTNSANPITKARSGKVREQLDTILPVLPHAQNGSVTVGR